MHPILIVGVALAGLPVLLHLIMKQEPKRLPFPALRFLKLRQRTNQRKMRLRHFLLLLLRVLLIALFTLALYQPTLQNDRFSLSGDQPVAAVFVIDTTPSMGYVVNDRSRLDDARKRAVDLLDALPAGSRVAVVDTADPTAAWEPSVGEARRRIESLASPRGGGSPVTTGLMAAYQLLRTVDAEADTSDGVPMPRLVAVFSDRTAACWDATRNDELVRLRDAVPPPAVAHLFADVGADHPVNVAVTAAEVRPQSVPQNMPVSLAVTLQAIGADVPTIVVRCRLDAAAVPERRELSLSTGTPKLETFTFKELKPGFHQAEVSLETADRLMSDNVRYVTFRVGQTRKILTISDDPDDARYWELALGQVGAFMCDVKSPAESGDFSGYEVVCLLSVADPSRPLPDGRSLWVKLAEYVGRGGKVLVIPGSTVANGAYDPTIGDAGGVLPGKLVSVIDTPADRPAGISWAIDDAALRHPLIAPFRDWEQQNVDFVKSVRRVRKYWDIQAPPEHVVVRYDDASDATKRRPAVLERSFGNGGKVVMLSVRMDSPWDETRKWHNYWETLESSWAVVFPDHLLRYLAGAGEDAKYNFTTSQTVSVPVPQGTERGPPRLVLEGPGVTGTDATPQLSQNQAELRLPPSRTLTTGNYVLRTENRSWQEAYSLNLPVEESDLDKVRVATIETVFGPNSIISAGKDLVFRAAFDSNFNRTLDLFPWLMIAVLILFTAESLISNRFYRFKGNALLTVAA